MRTNGAAGAHGRKQINGRGSKPSIAPASLVVRAQTDSYRVGPGRPPREHQFKPGQSGNPQGAKRKDTSIARDLKNALERALSTKITLGRGEKQRTVTKAVAGIEKFVDGFAEGDRFARRELIAFAKTLEFDLTMGRGKAVFAEAFTANDQALLDDYVRRHANEHMVAGNADSVSALQQDASTRVDPSNANWRR